MAVMKTGKTVTMKINSINTFQQSS